MNMKDVIESLKTKIKQLVRRMKVEEHWRKAKTLVSRENVTKLKQNILGLKTAEGRRIAVSMIRRLSIKQKALLACLLLAVLFVSIKCVSSVCSMVWGASESGVAASRQERMERDAEHVQDIALSVNGVSVDLRNLSKDDLDEVFLDSYEVPIGTVFDYSSSSSVRILSVVDSGVLVHYVKGRNKLLGLDIDEEVERINESLGRGEYNKVIHIQTDPSKYTDDNELKSGIFVRIGSYEYRSKMGIRKVESYLDVSSDELKKKISEYMHKLDEEEAQKLMDMEGGALDVDLDIKSFCGFVMGETPGQNWHLFTQSKNMPYCHKKRSQEYCQSGDLITPFRLFKKANATYTFYDDVHEHLYKVDLVTEYLEFWKEEMEIVKTLLEKKFGIKMVQNPNPNYCGGVAAYVWNGNKGERLMIEELGTRLHLILRSDIVDSMDESNAKKKKEDEERRKIMPAEKGIEVL